MPETASTGLSRQLTMEARLEDAERPGIFVLYVHAAHMKTWQGATG